MNDGATWMAIALVAAVTAASRLAGPLVMARVGASPRVGRFLDGLSISVVAALVASVVAEGGPREAAAVVVAGAITLLSRSTVWAMVSGMAVAAGWVAVAG